METIKIGAFELSDKDLDAIIEKIPPEQQMYAQNPEYRERLAQNLKEMLLFAAYAVDESVEESEDFKASMELARRDFLSQAAVKNVLESVDCDDAELETYYEDHKSQYKAQAYASAKHILVKEEEKANEILAKLQAEEMDFASAAQEFSTCPSKAQGGDLGLFNPGQMVPEFDQAVFTGPVNELIGPVKTQFGYHIILVTERNDGDQKSYDDVKDEVKQQLMAEKQRAAYAAKLEELTAKYIG